MSDAFAARLDATLREIDRAGLRRTRRRVEPHAGDAVQVRVDGRDAVNFCSNDYLGLAAHFAPARAAIAVLERRGTGAGASALVTGYGREHAALEEALAEHLGCERALLFSSGWAANCGVLRGLLGKGDRLLADELNHASLIDGGRLSGARYERVAHGDAAAFERALAAAAGDALSPGSLASAGTVGAHDAPLTLVATDAVFSMDGDLAPLPTLAALARRHGAALMVDDAHGYGVLGPQGRGSCAAVGVQPDVLMAGFGKALGAAGAVVAGSAALVETLVHRARSYVFSTALPPAVAAAVHAALRIVAGEEGDALRGRLFANVERFRHGCRERGIALALPPDAPATPIQPLLLGSAEAAVAASAALLERGQLVAAIRPPTVPPGTSRLRLTVSAAHTVEQVDDLLDALVAVLPACDKAGPGIPLDVGRPLHGTAGRFAVTGR